MGLLTKISQSLGFSSPEKEEERGVFVAWTGEDNFWTNFLPRKSAAGVDVTPEIAYQIGVVYACINKISSDIAQLPIELFDESERRFRLVNDHPALRLLNLSPNGNITSQYHRQSMVAFTLLFGSGYSWMERQDGRPFRLNPLSTMDVKEQKQVELQDFYRIVDRRNSSSIERVLSGRDVLRVRYLLSQSPVVVNKDTIGILKAAQDYAAQFFQNGGVMSGLLTSDNPMTQEQMKTLTDSWEKQKGKQTRFLPFGIKYQRFGVEPDKAQNTESRKFNAQEVCRLFNMPPAMIGLEGGSSYGDYENQVRHYVTHTIAPLCSAIEAEYNLKMLLPSEQRTMKFRHDLNELLRGDMKAKAEYYAKMLSSGVLSRNEVRYMERYNPIDGGDVHTVQINQMDLKFIEQYSDKISSSDKPEQNTNNDE
jgi:HK97 family phage portal protein